MTRRGEQRDGWRVRVAEDDAQLVLLAHALEHEDRDGVLLPPAETRVATRAARATSTEDRVWLAARARALVAPLAERQPEIDRLLRGSVAARHLMPLAVLAFLAGLATNALGPSQRIHVLALPLLGLLLWNVSVMTLGLVRRALPLRASGSRVLDGLRGWTERWARRPARAHQRPTPDDMPGREAVLTAIRERYLRDWAKTVRPLALARIRRLRQAASIALVAGVVVGMYARGMGFEYQATWESTFLSAGAVQGLLDTVLAPASMILGQPVPDIAGIRAPASGPAAPWIHLWAVTAALLVGVPRLLLMLGAWARAQRLHRALPVTLPSSYRRRLLVAAGEERHQIEVVPYSYRLDAAGVAALKALAVELFGPRTEVTVHDSAAYGDDGSEATDGAGLLERPGMHGGARIVVALFNLAQTPEAEVHAPWLAWVRDRAEQADAFLMVVDGEPYRRRLGIDPDAAGMVSRRDAWDRVAAGVAVTPVHTLLAEPIVPEMAEPWLTGARPEGVLDALVAAP